MKLSEYIAYLQTRLEEGDHEVVRTIPMAPIGAFTRKLTAPSLELVKTKNPRENYEKLCGLSADVTTGEKVWRI
jgi:hypothetical protein